MQSKPLNFPSWIATTPKIGDVDPSYIKAIQSALPVDVGAIHLARTEADFRNLINAEVKSATERARLAIVLRRLLTAWRMYCTRFNREQREAAARKIESVGA